MAHHGNTPQRILDVPEQERVSPSEIRSLFGLRAVGMKAGVLPFMGLRSKRQTASPGAPWLSRVAGPNRQNRRYSGEASINQPYVKN